MKRITKFPICSALFSLGVLIFAPQSQAGNKEMHDACKIWTLEEASPEEEQSLLTRPFVTPGKIYGIALDGGSIPQFKHQLPSLYFGPKVDCPLHLAMFVDWQAESGRRLLHRVYEIYRSDAGATLPALALTLLPGGSLDIEDPIQDVILAVHFVSNVPATLPTLIGEISAGSVSAELDAIHNRLRELEPEISPRVESILSRRKESFGKAFQTAQSQMRSNSALLGCKESSQLVSIRQILTGEPDAFQLAAFLTAAKSHQDTFLSSPIGQIPLIPPVGCDCKEKGHSH